MCSGMRAVCSAASPPAIRPVGLRLRLLKVLQVQSQLRHVTVDVRLRRPSGRDVALTARLLPMPGLQAGDLTQFASVGDSPMAGGLCDSRVMQIESDEGRRTKDESPQY